MKGGARGGDVVMRAPSGGAGHGMCPCSTGGTWTVVQAWTGTTVMEGTCVQKKQKGVSARERADAGVQDMPGCAVETAVSPHPLSAAGGRCAISCLATANDIIRNAGTSSSENMARDMVRTFFTELQSYA